VKVVSRSLRANTGLPDITGDLDVFRAIVDDMNKNAGKLRPEANWDIERGGKDGGQYFREHVLSGKESVKSDWQFDDEHFQKHFSSLKLMMEPWVGCTGKTTATLAAVRKYQRYLDTIDHLGLLEYYFDRAGNLREGLMPLMVTDLGSIMDVNLITWMLKDRDRLLIVEVGGGYGRLAEAFMNLFGPEQVRYVLIDAVPASLMFAHFYLENRLPNIRIGSYYQNDVFDLEKFPCYVIPAWHFERVNHYRYDVAVNIQSMQEMGQEHVDYYLSLFDAIASNKGLIYLSNEKDYVFRGTWNIPDNWRCLFRLRTPRSWTRNSPTEIFCKGEMDYSMQKQVLDFTYHKQLQDFDMITKLQQQVNRCQTVEKRLAAIERELHDLKTAVQRNGSSTK